MIGLLTLWLASLASLASPPTDSERLVRIDRMYASYRVAFSGVRDVSAAELKTTLDKGSDWVLVDVRPPVEREVSTLPGSITLAQLRADPAAYQKRRIVVFCTVGARSGWEARSLTKEGFDVRNLRGSLLAWTHAGGTLVDAAGAQTRRVHVYGRRWNLVASGYEPVITAADGSVEVLSHER
ncbi:MAG: hypothetical protein KTR31_19620 [Myxococcales bacterium]|nr:hypothetical protein [Myxococcales bacterium]